MDQVSGATREEAIRALRRTGGDVVNAIMEVSMGTPPSERIVHFEEPEEIDRGLVRQLTGSDTQFARSLYGEVGVPGHPIFPPVASSTRLGRAQLAALELDRWSEPAPRELFRSQVPQAQTIGTIPSDEIPSSDDDMPPLSSGPVRQFTGLRERIQGRESGIRTATTGLQMAVPSRLTIEEEILRERMNPTLGRPASPREAESFQTLLRQLYGLPVEVPSFLTANGLEAEVVPFDQVPSLQIAGFSFDPLLQPWAGPPTSPNRIITLALQDGRAVLVKARFDSKTNRLHPPV
jgi:hypothetical protein